MAATEKRIQNIPAHVPGQGVRDELKQSIKAAKSDAVAFGDTSPINLIELPGNVAVLGGYVYVETAFDASGTSAAATVTLAMPNDTGTETLYDASTIGLQSTGMKAFTAWAVTPASGGYVAATYTAGTTTAGSFRIYLQYVQEDDTL